MNWLLRALPRYERVADGAPDESRDSPAEFERTSQAPARREAVAAIKEDYAGRQEALDAGFEVVVAADGASLCTALIAFTNSLPAARFKTYPDTPALRKRKRYSLSAYCVRIRILSLGHAPCKT